MKTIQLSRGYTAQIDDDDFERVNKQKWYAQVVKQYVYAAHRFSRDGGGIVYLHKFILGLPNSVFVDHQDHNTLNCQKYNLRPCNNRQNQWNGVKPQKRSEHCSQYKGVTHERERWVARIREHDKKKHIGSFNTEWEAAEAYNRAATKIHGDFACLNIKCMLS